MSTMKTEIPARKIMQEEYESKRTHYETLLHEFQRDLKGHIAKQLPNPAMKARVKSFDSYYTKLITRLKNNEDASSITDILGLRAICPFQENLKTIETIIKDNYTVIHTEYKGIDHSFKEFGYSSIHLLVKMPYNKTLICEIQICTALQDAWSEIEHVLFYKKEFTPFDDPIKRKLAALNANLTLSDILFQEILDYQRNLQQQLNKRRENFIEMIDSEATDFDFDLLSSESSHLKKELKNIPPSQKNESSEDINHTVDGLLLDALEAHNNNLFAKAITIYAEILTYPLSDAIKAIIYLHRGMAYYAESDYEHSILDFTSALEIDCNNFKALYYRSMVHKVLHDYQLALLDLNLCIEINPYMFYPYYNRAQVYFYLKDYSRALADCEMALKIEPDSLRTQKFMIMIKSGLNI